MAERRCFSMKIVDSDAFMEMPLSTQCFYFHLGMRADDDGFVNNPRRIARLVGASDDDFKLLIAKRFLLLLDGGVVVIKHWRMHNTLKNDRLKMPQYPELAAKIYVKGNKSYTDVPEEGSPSLLDLKKQSGIQLDSKRIPNGFQLDSQGKGREEKGTEGNRKEEEEEGTDSSSAASRMEYFEGTLGKGVVFMTEEQWADLLDKLSIDEVNKYVPRLADYIINNPQKTIYSHYKTILKWVKEDRETI